MHRRHLSVGISPLEVTQPRPPAGSSPSGGSARTSRPSSRRPDGAGGISGSSHPGRSPSGTPVVTAARPHPGLERPPGDPRRPERLHPDRLDLAELPALRGAGGPSRPGTIAARDGPRHHTSTVSCASLWPRWGPAGASCPSGSHRRRRSPGRRGAGPRRRLPPDPPLAPRVDGHRIGELGLCQGRPSRPAPPPARHPRFGAHATPAMLHRPGRHPLPVAGGVDAGLRLHRRLLRPAPPDPVGVESVPRRQLDLSTPFRRRDIAVQSGDDETGRVPVLGGERLSVHPDDEERLASVVHGVEGEAAR